MNLLDHSLPTKITVLVGPRSSGKTRLLTHMKRGLDRRGVPISYLNCRQVARPSTDVISAFMLQNAIPQLLSILAKASVTFEAPVGKVQLSPFAGLAPDRAMAASTAGSSKTADMDSILNYYRELLLKIAAIPGAPRPMLVVDEANRLMQWEGDDKNLQRLLDFCVSVTKESNQAHVLLATSEAFFMDWIAAGELSTSPTSSLSLLCIDCIC